MEIERERQREREGGGGTALIDKTGSRTSKSVMQIRGLCEKLSSGDGMGLG